MAADQLSAGIVTATAMGHNDLCRFGPSRVDGRRGQNGTGAGVSNNFKQINCHVSEVGKVEEHKKL